MSAPNQPVTILVVDDDPGLARLMERELRRDGYETASAGSGREATEWLQQHRADLLLLDLKLPDLEGPELVKTMAAAGHKVPFIIITGQGDERVAVDMMKRGALDYLVKDVNFIEFIPTVVRRALEQLERERRLEAAEKSVRESEARYRHLVSALPIAVYACDTEGHITFFNEAAAVLWGREPVIGQDRWCGSHRLYDAEGSLVPHDECAVAVAVREGRSIRDVELIIERPDGTRRHALVFPDPVRDASGAVTGAVNMLVDITERRQLEQEVLEISAREQRRIGQDLHDDLCQWLAGTELLSKILARDLARESPAKAPQALEIAENTRQTLVRARMLARGLTPAVIGSEGLAGALRELAANAEGIFRIRCVYDGPDTVQVRDEVTALHLYRIAQEAISNAVRHGSAREVCMLLTSDEDRITMLIRDNGSGIPQPLPQTSGIGLRTMRYRAGFVGAALDIRPGATGGTEIACTFSTLERVTRKAPH